MRITDSVQFLKALADRSRILIINALIDHPHYVEELSERLDLTPPTVSFHLKKLEESGIIHSTKEQYYSLYHLNREMIDRPLYPILYTEDFIRKEQEERMWRYRQKVIRTFFKDGKLMRIPVQRKKRRIILEELIQQFETGRLYSEKEISSILSEFHEDFCTLRREMICEKLMIRDQGMYQVFSSECSV